MRRPAELPGSLGNVFTVADAVGLGVDPERMRRNDLDRPFHGVRRRPAAPDAATSARGAASGSGPAPAREAVPQEFRQDFEKQAQERRERALEYLPRMLPGQFFSHETSAVLWGAPLPLVTEKGVAVDGRALPVHVSVFGDAPLPRARGVRGHRASARTSSLRVREDLPVSSPATTWASLGALHLHDLVAIGDFLCRKWRPGVGRVDAGRDPIATLDELAAVIAAGRRVGIRRLRRALELVREDSWSPRESRLRCILVEWGLPEPELNIDVFDDAGRFLGCLDLAYPELKVAIEYHGIHHSATYAKDVERIARLRAAGWIVIEVTAALLVEEAELVRRVRSALRVARAS